MSEFSQPRLLKATALIAAGALAPIATGAAIERNTQEAFAQTPVEQPGTPPPNATAEEVLACDKAMKEAGAVIVTADYKVGKRAVATAVVIKPPVLKDKRTQAEFDCADKTKTTVSLEPLQWSVGKSGTAAGKSKVRSAGDPVAVDSDTLAKTSTFGETRIEKGATPALPRKLTARDGRLGRYGLKVTMTTEARSPYVVVPGTATYAPSPAATTTTETIRSNPWLVIPADAKKNTKEPTRAGQEGIDKLTDECNLLAGLSISGFGGKRDRGKYIDARLIEDKYEEKHQYVIKLKEGAKWCRGKNGEIIFGVTRKTEWDDPVGKVETLQPQLVGKNWARYVGEGDEQVTIAARQINRPVRPLGS